MSVLVRRAPTRDASQASDYPDTGREPAVALVRHGGRRGVCLLIEPQAMVRRGLALMLAGHRSGIEVQEAATVEQGIAMAAHAAVDLVLVDIAALPGDRMEELRRLSRMVQPAAILVTSGEGAPHLARACLAAGARGFVAKSDPSAVLELVADLLLQRGERGDVAYVQIPRWAIGGGTSAGGAAAEDAGAAGALEALTARQREIFHLLEAGCSNKEIARRLGVLEGTVKVHVRAVMGRLGLRNRTQVAILAARAAGRRSESA